MFARIVEPRVLPLFDDSSTCLFGSAGGAKPQPPKKKRLVDYGEYLVPVACALFVPVSLGFGFVVSHIFLG